VPILVYIVTAIVAYLLGSIPTGYLVTKTKGIDIRVVGSGNIGATNTFRAVGARAGLFVLLADAAKGWVAVQIIAGWLARSFLPPDSTGGSSTLVAIIAGFAVILGHNYTCWLSFKGGKGIATSAGVLVALVPLPLLVLLGVWIIVFVMSRYVSLASISAAVVLPFATWFLLKRLDLTLATAAMSALAIFKHKANIQRLLAGTESRFGRRKAAVTEAKNR